ncbi:MAG: SpaA isopeptide-forming pilin-related protein, partial [Hydrogeniiclostridium sp.]
MSKKIKKSMLRVMTAVLAVLCMFTQLPVTSAFAAGSNIIKLLEKNSFDGLRWASKTPMAGYNGSYTTDIMGVTIDGVNYIAYCLNHDRYGSGDAYGEYSVKVYDLDDPALQTNQEFLNDKNILMYMQGVLASGGYTGGGDSAATALRTRGSNRQLFNNRFEAYGVTKFAMWTLSVGQSDASKWSVNPTATYDASRNQYLLESLNQIMASANNWKDFVDSNVYAVPKTDGDGNIIWQEGPEEGEHYVEWEITTGYFGNGKVQDSEHVYMDSTYTLTPGSLPSGFHLEKLDGTPITGQTTMQGRYQNAWNGEPFRLVAEDGVEPSSFGELRTVATINTQLQTGGLKYGIAEYTAHKVQNYALVPENGMEVASTEVKLAKTEPKGASFIIRKADGSQNLANAQFMVTSADGSWMNTVTTGSSGSISVEVPTTGLYYVEETRAPSGYALDSTRYSVEVKSGEVVELKVENSKSVGLKIQKLDALTDEPLAGAVFTVEQIDGTFSTDVTTNDNGLALLGGLQPGSYKITEKTPPAGYLP